MSPITENQYLLFITLTIPSFRDARRAGPETMNTTLYPGSAKTVFLNSGLAGLARAAE
jgi:hypothetical protein